MAMKRSTAAWTVLASLFLHGCPTFPRDGEYFCNSDADCPSPMEGCDVSRQRCRVPGRDGGEVEGPGCPSDLTTACGPRQYACADGCCDFQIQPVTYDSGKPFYGEAGPDGLAFSDDGRVHLAVRGEGGSVVYLSRGPGETGDWAWTTVLGSGSADRPSLATDGGRVGLAWSNIGDEVKATLANIGEAFAPASTVNAAGKPLVDTRVAARFSGNHFSVAWLQGDPAIEAPLYVASTVGDLSWTNVLVRDNSQPGQRPALHRWGNGLRAGVLGTQASSTIDVFDLDPESSSSVVLPTLGAKAGPSSELILTGSSSFALIAAWLEFDGANLYAVHWARLNSGTAAWQPAEEVPNSEARNGLAGDFNAATEVTHLFWQHGNTGNLMYSRRYAATWHTVSMNVGGRNPSVVVDDSCRPHVLYTDDGTGELMYAR